MNQPISQAGERSRLFWLLVAAVAVGCEATGSSSVGGNSPGSRVATLASTEPAGVKSASSAAASQATKGCSTCVVRSSQLHEDPEAGRRAWERLRARQTKKEKTRPLRWDHRHLKEHEAIVAAIEQARARYDEAATKAALESARMSMTKRIPEIRSQVHEIDPWRNGSALLDDYQAILDVLEKPYPQARLASLEGNETKLTTVRADLDARLKGVRQWLEKAAKYEDQYK